jgi:glutamate N-acetyltransferase/amino-acid N-acetyltransferase
MNYTVKGFDAGAVAAGIKKTGAPDLALVASRMPCRAAGVFTRNLFPAAPVIYDRQLLASIPKPSTRCSSTPAAPTPAPASGGRGQRPPRRRRGCAHLGAHEHSVFVMSTGVIGVQLPMDKLLAGDPCRGEPAGARRLGSGRASDHDHRHAAQAGAAASIGDRT